MAKKILSPKIANLNSQQFYDKYLKDRKRATIARYLRYYNSLRRKKKLRPFAPKWRKQLTVIDHYFTWVKFKCRYDYGQGRIKHHDMAFAHYESSVSDKTILEKHKDAFEDHAVENWDRVRTIAVYRKVQKHQRKR